MLLEYPGLKSVFCGIAGIATGDNAARLSSDLKKRYPQLKIEIKNDSFNLLATCDRADMAIISGTGSVVFVRKGEEFIRLGGWGYLLEEGGSGYYIGRDAIYSALMQEEGSLTTTPLYKAVLEKSGKPKVLDAIADLYKGGKKELASFAPLVFNAADQNDPVAKEILAKNAKAIANLINRAKQLSGMDTVKAVIVGGLMSRNDLLIPLIKEGLLEGITLDIYTDPPVNGAINLAMA